MAARFGQTVAGRRRQPLVFHFTAPNFWNSLKSPCYCPHSDAELGGDLPYAEVPFAELGHSIVVEDPLLRS
jgi:hypothetical protein